MRQVQPSSRTFPRSTPAVAALVLVSLLCLRCSEPDNDACPDDGKQIQLISPKGGESFRVGDSLRVKWRLCNAGVSAIDAVDPMLSPDSGKTWCFMKVNSIPRGDKTFGNYAWKIPDSIQFQGQWFPLTNNSKCRVKVEQYTPFSDSQRSIGNVFTIK
jgi:hypothetical protein